ncbi:hypothetical protein XENOCAPTIV_030075, partial [Xenoophorus captivus]
TDDAETQVDQLTPLMDSIKKEAGETVLTHMEERLAAPQLHPPPSISMWSTPCSYSYMLEHLIQFDLYTDQLQQLKHLPEDTRTTLVSELL